MKIFCRMTTKTVITELTSVHVIGPVTPRTGSGQSKDGLHGTFMTRPTGEIRMRPVDLEPRTQIVVKVPERPVNRVMAILTDRAQRFFMHIILLMTIDAP